MGTEPSSAYLKLSISFRLSRFLGDIGETHSNLYAEYRTLKEELQSYESTALNLDRLISYRETINKLRNVLRELNGLQEEIYFIPGTTDHETELLRYFKDTYPLLEETSELNTTNTSILCVNEIFARAISRSYPQSMLIRDEENDKWGVQGISIRELNSAIIVKGLAEEQRRIDHERVRIKAAAFRAKVKADAAMRAKKGDILDNEGLLYSDDDNYADWGDFDQDDGYEDRDVDYGYRDDRDYNE